MVSKVVFHIGDHKTGSTACQVVLAQGTWTSDGPSVAYMSRLNSRGLATSLFKKGRRKFREPRFEALARKIDQSDADIAVVSDEAFEKVRPQALARAIDDYMPHYRDKVQVIAYVRPHVDRMRASYTQMIKLGITTTTMEQFVEAAIAKGKYLYTPRFTAWRAQFGDRFTLRPMIRSQLVGNDVVRDLFHHILDGADFQYTPSGSSNTGLPFSDLVMLRAFHRAGRKDASPGQNRLRGDAGWHLSRVLEGLPTQDTVQARFPPEVIRRIMAHYAEDARALDQAFFDKPLLAPALTETLTETLTDSAPATLSYEVADHFDADGQRLIGVWGHLADDLLTRDPEDWKGYFRQLWIDEIEGAEPGSDSGRESGEKRQGTR